MPEAPFEKPHEHPLKLALPGEGGVCGNDDRVGAPPAVRYAELHCLSNFSFLRGASHPEELIEQAARLGYAAIAITDRNSLAGVVRAHVAAKHHGVHLIIGAEITPIDGPPIVLLATDRASYGRLSRLITVGRLRARKGDCILYVADVAEHAAGLIAVIQCEEQGNKGTKEQSEDAPPATVARDERLATANRCSLVSLFPCSRLLSAFEGRLYLAVSLDYGLPDEIRLMQAETAAQLAGLPLIATNRVLYHVPERRQLQDVLTCIREKCTLAEAGGRLMANAERHLRPLDEIARRHRGREQLLERTFEIAQRCTFTLDELRYEYPSELVPPGRTAMDYLEELTWRGVARESDGATQRRSDEGEEGAASLSSLRRSVAASLRRSEVTSLVSAELALIRELRYEHFFLTVWDLCEFARSRGILCQGRGSAANSAVCYYLGITAVDPTKHDLLFERFMSKERNEPPDIDVDFEHERREEVFQYIYRKYGRERAAIVAEVISYRPRSAIRDVGKALGMSLDRIDMLAKSVDWYDKWPKESDEPGEQGNNGKTEQGGAVSHARDAPEQMSASRAARARGGGPGALYRNNGVRRDDATMQELVRLVRQLLGFPRHLSQHVGGFVITESPLCEIVPLENGAMPDRTFIEWDKDDIDALGILKVDCLALGMLTAIRKCFDFLNQRRSDGATKRRGEEEVADDSSPTSLCRSVAPSLCRSVAPSLLTNGDHNASAYVSRSNSLAESDGPGRVDLPVHSTTAGQRAIRTPVADASLVGFDSVQYRRGARPADAAGFHSLPQDSSRIADGTANTDNARRAAQIDGRDDGSAGTRRRSGSNSASADSQPRKAGLESDEATKRRSDGGEDSGATSFVFPASLRRFVAASLSLRDIPADDASVYDMICRADTVGVFQIESRAQMSMLPRLRPRNFYDLVIEVAIVRPGPIQGGMVHPYLRRRSGQEKVAYPSDAVRRVLEKTLGVPIFQEQAMKLAVVAAGFTPGEADQLRRAMAAWRRGGQIEKFQIKLIKGMLDNGYSREFAEQLYRQIQGFGEYGFPESHAASFALLVYASCWLKHHHPAAFCAAMLNSQPLGFYTPGQLIRDAVAHGVEVRGVDVAFGEWDCTLEERDRGIEGSRDREKIHSEPHSDTERTTSRRREDADGGQGDLSRVDRLAKGDRIVQDGLSDDGAHAAGRAFWSDEPDAKSGRLGSEQHRRGQRAAVDARVHPVSFDRARLSGRVGDAVDSGHGDADDRVDRRRSGAIEGGSPYAASAHEKPVATTNQLTSADVPNAVVTSTTPSPKSASAVRLGLRLIRGITESCARKIITACAEALNRSRASGRAPSSLDPSIPRSLDPSLLGALARLPGVTRDALLRLAAADAFRSLGVSRRQALWRILAMDRDESLRRVEPGETPSLFAGLETDEPPADLPPISDAEIVAQDYDMTGFSLHAHPMGLIRPELGSLGVIANEELKRAKARRRVSVAGLVTVRQRPGTAKGVVFMTLEDETGMANLIFRPQVYERERRIARGRSALIAEGTIERQGEVVHVMVTRVHDLSERLGALRHVSRDFH